MTANASAIVVLMLIGMLFGAATVLAIQWYGRRRLRSSMYRDPWRDR